MAIGFQDAAAYGVVLSVQIVFASYQIMTKIAFERTDVDPAAFAVLRMVGACILFWILAWFKVPPKQMWPRSEHQGRVARMGLFMFGNVMGLVLALSFTTSAMVAMLQVLRPIFAGVISWTLGLERPTTRQIVGLVLCVMGGASIVIFSHTQDTLERSIWQSWIGAGLVCLHSFCIAFYVLEQPQLISAGCSPLAINAQAYTLASLLGAFVMMLPGVRPKGGAIIQMPHDWFAWLTIAHAVVLVAVYSYVAMAWAAKKLGGVVVMLFMLLQAVIILAVGHVLLKEVLYAGQLVGAFFVLLGILTFILDPSAGSHPETLPMLESEGKKTNQALETAGKYLSNALTKT